MEGLATGVYTCVICGVQLTFRQLYEAMQKLVAKHADHEALDHQVVIRLHVDDDLHCGGLQSAAVEVGCAEVFALVLDGDQEPEE